MRRALALFVMLSLVACGGTGTEVLGVRTVDPSEAAGILSDDPDGLVVLDIRTREEYRAGTVPGAVNIDFYAADFSERLADLDRDRPYVMFCRSGNRSAEAARLMRDLDFREVYEVDGGILAWANAGEPVVVP